MHPSTTRGFTKRGCVLEMFRGKCTLEEITNPVWRLSGGGRLLLSDAV